MVNALGVTLIYAMWNEDETPEERVLGDPLVSEGSGSRPPVEPLDADGSDDR